MSPMERSKVSTRAGTIGKNTVIARTSVKKGKILLKTKKKRKELEREEGESREPAGGVTDSRT